MIDAKELRIGNYLEIEGRFSPVLAIDNQREFTHSKTKEFFKCAITVGEYDDNGLMWTTSGRWLKNFNPIPLTEQWLIDLGFTNCGINKLGIDNFTIHTPFPKLEDDFVWFNNVNSAMVIDSVHQLQNLYFALTGKELIKKQ
jgi:hypothetical protein